jgi:hypothetical protein
VGTAVELADGPVRRLVEYEVIFDKFCEEVGSFTDLFKVDQVPHDNTNTADRALIGIPDSIMKYLHENMENVYIPSACHESFVVNTR